MNIHYMYKIYKRVLNSKVIYIGITSLSLNRRKSAAYNKNISSILKNSSIELIEETNDKTREYYWINYYRELGYELLNYLKKPKIQNKRTEYFKKYYQDNIEKIKSNNKKYSTENKEKISEYQKNYNKLNYKNTYPIRSEYFKEYHAKNKGTKHK